MLFNNPSMQMAYHAQYSQVRDVRKDFIALDAGSYHRFPCHHTPEAWLTSPPAVVIQKAPWSPDEGKEENTERHEEWLESYSND
jgi:hypothetical protein